MSYILDALKKIEHEKNKRTGPRGRVNISGDLFQERSRPAAKTGIWKIALLVAGASLATAAVTWFVLPGNSRKSAAVIRPAVPPTPAPVKPPAAPAVPLPVQSPAPPVTAPSAAVPAPPVNVETVHDNDSSPRKVHRLKERVKAHPPSANSNQAAQAVQVRAPADIKLSGIAWQDERSARRAVINGFLLKEGAAVSGAKIIDIQIDRVRFSSPAGQFEIKLDAVLPAEVKR